MRYECERCGTTCFTTDPEHLCKDVRERLERQERATKTISGVIRSHFTTLGPTLAETIARDVLKALGGRDLGL